MARYRYDKDMDCIVEIRDGSNWLAEQPARGPQIIRDLQPYKTAAGDVANNGNRTVIGGRRQHREFLKRNGLVEVGNEAPKARKPIRLSKKERVEDIKRAVHLLRTDPERARHE